MRIFKYIVRHKNCLHVFFLFMLFCVVYCVLSLVTVIANAINIRFCLIWSDISIHRRSAQLGKMDYSSYVKSLTSQYGLKESSAKETMQQLQDKLNQDKIKLQQLFKEKLLASKTSKKSSTHIKQINEQIKDLSEDIGELDTCLLILRHKLPQGRIVCEMLLGRNVASYERGCSIK